MLRGSAVLCKAKLIGLDGVGLALAEAREEFAQRTFKERFEGTWSPSNKRAILCALCKGW